MVVDGREDLIADGDREAIPAPSDLAPVFTGPIGFVTYYGASDSTR